MVTLLVVFVFSNELSCHDKLYYRENPFYLSYSFMIQQGIIDLFLRFVDFTLSWDKKIV